MKVFFKTSENTYPATKRRNPEKLNPLLYGRGNRKTCKNTLITVKTEGTKMCRQHFVTETNTLCCFHLLGALGKLRKASSCVSVCPSVYMEQLRSHWTDFH